MTRRPVAVALVALVAACGPSQRDRARDDLVDQLVAGGLDRDVAECTVDGFFEERSSEELAAFFDRQDLTDDERADFARLGRECTTGL